MEVFKLKKLIKYVLVLSVLIVSIFLLFSLFDFNNNKVVNSKSLTKEVNPLNQDTESEPYTFDEWRTVLLSYYNKTLEDLDDLEYPSIESINYLARIYASWSNGTITNEEKEQLLDEYFNSPIVTPPLLVDYSDNYFWASFSVLNNWPAGYQHTFRVYAYLDYDRTDTGSGGLFHDGSSKKGPYGPYGILDAYPYDSLPYISDLNPDEDFMGSERKRLVTHHGQLENWVIPHGFDATCDNPLSPDKYPGNIYFRKE